MLKFTVSMKTVFQFLSLSAHKFTTATITSGLLLFFRCSFSKPFSFFTMADDDPGGLLQAPMLPWAQPMNGEPMEAPEAPTEEEQEPVVETVVKEDGQSL
jgi:hypothetical protein